MEHTASGDGLRRESYREGETVLLEVETRLPTRASDPPAVAAYYRAYAAAVYAAARTRLLPAAQAAFFAMPQEKRRYGFRRYRLTVRCETPEAAGHLFVLRTVTVTAPPIRRRVEAYEIFRLADGRRCPLSVFLRAAGVDRPPTWLRRARDLRPRREGEAWFLVGAGDRRWQIPTETGGKCPIC